MSRQISSKAIASRGAFSDCGAYRYTLERRFMFGEGMVLFLMLNPSTADEDFNDPTVAKCERLAMTLGFVEMTVANLFAYRATDPKDMKLAHRQGVDVVGVENDAAIQQLAARAEMIICAWGNHGSYDSRALKVRDILKDHQKKLHCLEVNGSGEPKHPLYVRGERRPVLWRADAWLNQ